MIKLKTLIIVITICLISTTSFAQYKKGDVTLGFGINLDMAGPIPIDMAESQFIYLYPQLNYFISDKTSIGLEIPFNIASYKNVNYKIGTSIKFYLGNNKNKTILQNMVGIAFQKSWLKWRSLPYIEIKIGRSYFLSEKLRWELTLSFENIGYSGKFFSNGEWYGGLGTAFILKF